METMVTFLPMMALAAIDCNVVLSITFWYGMVLWMLIATAPCARMFLCPSLNDPL